jgi:thiamine-phosphate pyrophosphorylase
MGGVRRWPRIWLFSDPVRLPEPAAAARRLPRGAGVVARGLSGAALARLGRVVRERRLVLLVGGDGRAALRARAGLHWPDREAVPGRLAFLAARRRGVPWARLSVATHGSAGLARGRRLRADAVFLSPVFATASHPGAVGLGVLRWAGLGRRAGRPVVALGGMGARQARRLPGWAAGWAAIGAWQGAVA